MKLIDAIEMLEEHNKWRRAEGRYVETNIFSPNSPRDIGIAIDTVLLNLKKGIQ